jgi:NADH-quinone oxidoreductase subunit G
MDMLTITIDGRQARVPSGTTLLEAARGLGIEIPHFCYHPGLSVAGVCRMCLVQVEGAPKLQIACNTPAADGMIVRTRSPEVVEAQKGMLEFLLLDHPLDCPICDKGGECPLQDFTQRYGPGGSRFDFDKRTTYKRRPLGPHILFDEERCILCWRCTRFSEEITGRSELGLVQRGARTQVDLAHGAQLEDRFQGNLADICPVGALTSRGFRFQARPWELRRAKTTCQLCPVGCAMEAWSLKGRLVRVTASENLAVNDYWICDRGRYGHDDQNAGGRVTQPMVRREGALVPVPWGEALAAAADKLRGNAPAGIVAGADLTNEDYFALQRLARDVLHTADMDLIEPEPPADVIADLLAKGPALDAIPDLESAGAIAVIGEDLERTHPVYLLRLIKAMRRGVPVVVIASEPTRLAGMAAAAEIVEPAGLAGRLAHLAAARRAGARASVGADATALAGAIAGREPLAVVLNAPARAAELMPAARELASPEGGRAAILLLPRGANAQGARDMGFAPGFLPGYRPALSRGRDLDGLRRAALAGDLGALLLVYVRGWPATGAGAAAPDGEVAGAEQVGGCIAELCKARARVVMAGFLGPGCEGADVVLPAMTPLESPGTRTTPDRRVLAVQRAMPSPAVAQPVWALAQAIANQSGARWNFTSEKGVLEAIRAEAAPYRDVTGDEPGGKAWDTTSLRTA